MDQHFETQCPENISFQYENPKIVAEPRGDYNTPDYRIYFKDEGGPISALHDIPLWVNKSKKQVNMIIAAPRWTNAKLKINLELPLNPITHKLKRGVLHMIPNIFPNHGYSWNYGTLPQTWEDPHKKDPRTHYRGDNNPLDVIEVGCRVLKRGTVVPVKFFGAIPLLDDDETDWKLLAVAVDDPLANDLNTVKDLEKYAPGFLKNTVDWFRLYKALDNGPILDVALNGQAQEANVALSVIEESHKSWHSLVHGTVYSPEIHKENTTIVYSDFRISRKYADKLVFEAPPITTPKHDPRYIDSQYFLSDLLQENI